MTISLDITVRKRFEDYQRYGKKLGIEVVENMALDTADEHISSSVVRKHIKNGEIKAANHDLGYIYTLEGKIVTGFQNGHKLGYPTANMDPKTCFNSYLPMVFMQ